MSTDINGPLKRSKKLINYILDEKKKREKGDELQDEISSFKSSLFGLNMPYFEKERQERQDKEASVYVL